MIGFVVPGRVRTMVQAPRWTAIDFDTLAFAHAHMLHWRNQWPCMQKPLLDC